MAKTYLCSNSACTLGSVSQPGRFTSGITKEQVHLVTGAPRESLERDKDFGDGFCPNCGQRGKEEK